MLNRKFTMRENIFLVALAVLFLGLFYYLAVAKPVFAETARCVAEQGSIEEELSVELMMAAKKKQMLEAMEKTPSTAKGDIYAYNNLKNEMTELYGILSGTVSYNIGFSEARALGTIVRRDISVSFQTDSYAGAEAVLEQMENSRYRSMIKDVELSSGTGRGQSAGMSKADTVNVSVVITFYETTVGAKTTEGLVFEENKAESAGIEVN